jgi:biopolymer transport protein ExbB/TolQ
VEERGLGTISGMVTTFASLGGNRDAALTAGAGAGISVALAATQYGILLAVPAMLSLWALRRRAEALLERTASDDRQPSEDAP